ncbi:unnamed protein product [Adineta ricciae]|uniref:Uncharacterized protein n=1 Tax=Adineta ricciae TaxID=249248 RepID=A0A813XVE3_ADIRI|nr:unnamed protein product [Adineta ricciae]CAF0947281.1 unnamed protein product [Adineta ricciae]
MSLHSYAYCGIPIGDQYRSQSFCARAIDNANLQSNQWCFTFLVGFESPDIIRPTLAQGSASPVGTIFQNHTLFSIPSRTLSITFSQKLN